MRALCAVLMAELMQMLNKSKGSGDMAHVITFKFTLLLTVNYCTFYDKENLSLFFLVVMLYCFA